MPAAESAAFWIRASSLTRSRNDALRAQLRYDFLNKLRVRVVERVGQNGAEPANGTVPTPGYHPAGGAHGVAAPGRSMSTSFPTTRSTRRTSWRAFLTGFRSWRSSGTRTCRACSRTSRTFTRRASLGRTGTSSRRTRRRLSMWAASGSRGTLIPGRFCYVILHPTHAQFCAALSTTLRRRRRRSSRSRALGGLAGRSAVRGAGSGTGILACVFLFDAGIRATPSLEGPSMLEGWAAACAGGYGSPRILVHRPNHAPTSKPPVANDCPACCDRGRLGCVVCVVLKNSSKRGVTGHAKPDDSGDASAGINPASRDTRGDSATGWDARGWFGTGSNADSSTGSGPSSASASRRPGPRPLQAFNVVPVTPAVTNPAAGRSGPCRPVQGTD